jgi:hypothetical protein
MIIIIWVDNAIKYVQIIYSEILKIINVKNIVLPSIFLILIEFAKRVIHFVKLALGRQVINARLVHCHLYFL